MSYRPRFDPNIWLLLALSVFAWAPLLTPVHFLNAHDARHSIFYLVEFDQTWRDGYLWPRWSPDFAFGYGYPLFNLYAPLAIYAAEILHLAGLSFVAAIKAMYILATVAAGLGMAGFGQRLFGRRAGLLAGVAYMYVPFHLAEIFVRSAFAEFVALAVVPFLFWAFTELIAAPSPRRAALAGVMYGLLALVHLTSFFTFSPFLMVYILFLIIAKSKVNGRRFIHRASYALAAGILGLALAAIYLLPLLTEARFVKVEQWTSGSYNYLQHFVYLAQFFSPDWGYGYSGLGLQDDFSFQLGIVFLVLTMAALVNIMARRFAHYSTALFFLISTIVVVLLMSSLAEPIWRIVPIATLVQFPWRLLAMTAFTMSIVIASLLAPTNLQSPTSPPPSPDPKSQIPNPKSPLYLLCLIIILASFAYTLPQYTAVPTWAETPLAVINWDRGSITDRVGMVSVTLEQPQTSPMEAEYLASGRPNTVAGIISGQGTVETLHHGGASDVIRVTAPERVTVQFYTYDYPGWQVTRDGQPLAHRHEPPFGLVTIDLPAGEHTVTLAMGATLPRTLGIIVTGLALLLIVLIFLVRSI
ncbi:MAG TPA: DUF6541 family protein [Anaerolineae bacterium]